MLPSSASRPFSAAPTIPPKYPSSKRRTSSAAPYRAERLIHQDSNYDLELPHELVKLFVPPASTQDLFDFETAARSDLVKKQKALAAAASKRPSTAPVTARAGVVHHKQHHSRPDLLSRLTVYLTKELQALGISPVGHEARLAVYREVFGTNYSDKSLLNVDVDVFIDEFKTYKGVLSEIKNEYEALIKNQQSTIAELEPYRRRIVLTKYEAARQLDELNYKANLDTDKQNSTISNLKVEVYEKNNHIAALQKEIADLHVQLKDKNDMANQIVMYQEQISEMQMKYQELESLRQQDVNELTSASKEIKRQLEKCKTDLAHKTEECNSIVSNSVPKSSLMDAMARNKSLKEDLTDSHKEIEKMTNDIQKLELEIAQQRLQISRLESLNAGAQGAAAIDWLTIGKVLNSREIVDPLEDLSLPPVLRDIENMLPKLKTPTAPDIEPPSAILIKKPFDEEVQANLTEKRSTLFTWYKERAKMSRKLDEFILSVLQEIIETKIHEESLLTIITNLHTHAIDLQIELANAPKKKKKSAKGKKTPASQATAATGDKPETTTALIEDLPEFRKFFVGLGESMHVPKFLRYSGNIQNHFLTKDLTVALINDVWKDRISASVGTKVHKVSLADFYYTLLKKRFTATDVVMEWSYNIFESCKRFSDQSVDCTLFVKILLNQLDERHYIELRKIMDRIKIWLERLAVATQNMLVEREDELNKAEQDFVTPTLLRKDFVWDEIKKTEFEELVNPLPLDKTQVPQTDAKPIPSGGSATSNMTEMELYQQALLRMQTGLDNDQSGEYINYQYLCEMETDSQFLEEIKRYSLGRIKKALSLQPESNSGQK